METLSRLPRADVRQVKVLTDDLRERPNSTLLGLDYRAWDNVDDLCHFKQREELDKISNWLFQSFAQPLNRVLGKYIRTDQGVIFMDEKHLLFPTTVLSVILSSLTPVAAVAVLYAVHNMWRRIAVLAVFTALFTVILALITTAKRIEIFAAAAA